MNCPNGTIEVKSVTIDTPDGKKKKVLDKYIYNLGMCTFCGLCVKVCPSSAIKFSSKFEHAVFNKNKLVKTLNKEGSTLKKGAE
jgi:NADH-quinone oxidoreductase subunit I